MGITKFYDEIQSDFYLYGRMDDELYIFETGIEYEGFLAQRKFEYCNYENKNRKKGRRA